MTLRRAPSLPRAALALPPLLLVLACGGVELSPVPPPPALEEFAPAVREQYGNLRAELETAEHAANAEETEEQRSLGETLGRLGMWYHAYGLRDGALTAYGNARRLFPEDPRWAYLQGVLLAEKGETEKALDAYRTALEHTASGAERAAIQVRAAEVDLLAGRAEAAAGRLESVVDPSSEDNVRGLVTLARAHRTAGRIDAAIDLYQRAIRAQPDQTGLRYLLGLALRDAGRGEEAAFFITQADADSEPDSLRMHDPWIAEVMVLDIGFSGLLRRARRLAGLGQYRAALRTFQQAAKLEPERPVAQLGIARVQLQLGQGDEAAALAQALLERVPDSAEAHSILGRIAARSGRNELAESRYRRALELDPTLFPTWRYLAFLLRGQGRSERAAEAFEAAHRLAPTDSEIICALAELLAEQGRQSEARDLLTRTLGFADEPWSQRLLLLKLEEAPSASVLENI